MDRFLKFVAMDIIQCNWDGYALNRNNWRLYHDVTRDKMIFMPHGLDQMFGVMRTGPNMPIRQQQWNGIVARQLFTTSEGNRRYLETIAALYTNVFDVAKITNRVAELGRAIRPAFAERSPQLARNHDNEVRALMMRIAQRGSYLRQQLNMPVPVPPAGTTLKFDADGTAKLAGWKGKTDATGGGNPTFAEEIANGGTQMLQIVANNGPISASYRTTVPLSPGRYRFEGEVKLENYVPSATAPDDARGGGGVCLRISREYPKHITAATGWTRLVFNFEVAGDAAPVELICESRAQSGKAIFNSRSLKLVKE